MTAIRRAPLVWSFVAGFAAGGLAVGVAAWVLVLEIIGPFLGPGAQDFSYSLTGGYELLRTSSHHVRIWPASLEQSKLEIGPKVVELAWDDRFILAERQSLGQGHDPVDGAFDYWILDTRTPRLSGPLDYEEFTRKRHDLEVPSELRMRDVYWYLRQ